MVNYLLHSPGKYADVVELVDSLDLGSNAQACRFESCHPHQKKDSALRGCCPFLVWTADSKRAAERSEVKKCPVDTFLARGKVHVFLNASVRMWAEMHNRL